jgi:3-methyl-2-oxobutanoate hydroxymethyltransferase
MPRFVKNFMVDSHSIPEALSSYVNAVKNRAYPGPEHCFS